MKIDETRLRALERSVASLGGLEARVGVLATKGATTSRGKSFTMAELAYVNEYGSKAAGVPQRSFIRSAFEGRQPEIDKLAARAARAVVEGRVTARQAVGLLGEWGVARVRENMTRGIAPALAPSTLAKRKRVQAGRVGSDKPLIDTGRLRQAISSDVQGRGGDE